MSNREIDRKIAELLGYTLSESVPEDYCFLGEDLTHVPDFSSDWNAMRLLVEWLREKEIKVYISFQRSGVFAHTSKNIEAVVDETAPLALCKAVLALPAELLGPKGSDSTEQAQAEEGSD